jgi:hypothetical protein
VGSKPAEVAVALELLVAMLRVILHLLIDNQAMVAME